MRLTDHGDHDCPPAGPQRKGEWHRRGFPRMAYADERTYGSAKYHGMKVGGVHHWTYPGGQWTERKVAPDQWDVTFTSLKRRNRKAPRGSGAEVGSGYHWLIVAHQWVDKLDANTYATQLEGRKFLVAFRRPDWPVWNTQLRTSRRSARDRTIAALKAEIRRLEAGGDVYENVIDQAALVDLAASFEAEEGLPPGTTPLAARLRAMVRGKREKKRSNVAAGRPEGPAEPEQADQGDPEPDEADLVAAGSTVRPVSRRRAASATPGQRGRRRQARRPARRRAVARRPA